MKSFFKFTLASFLGVILGGILLFLIGFIIMSAIVASADKPVSIKNNSILEIKLNRVLTDRGSDNPFSDFDILNFRPEPKVGLNTILENIEKAKTDDKIKGIYLNISAISSSFGGYGILEEIREKLKDFKTSGKFIVSYNNYGYSQKSYYVASVADSIFINPEGNILMLGMGGERTFYKRFLEKIGVEAQVVRVGAYKSATEPYFRESMSKESREQTMAYIGAICNQILTRISEERGISVEKLNQLTDEFTIRKPSAAKEHKLIDGLVYEDEMQTKLKLLAGIAEDKKLRLVSTSQYAKAPKSNYKFSKNKIAVVYASGAIGFEQSASSIGPELAKSIRNARKDSTVKAIVLRVNSPGGSALISDIIWREVELASKTKPVIASMSNVAASGGYYISCAADTIVADHNTITGSIGIYGLFFSGEELLKEKLGISTDAYGTNKFSSFGGGYPIGFLPFSSRKFTTEERAILQGILNEGYDTFLTRVADGRELPKEEIRKVAEGRVWNAMDAQKVGLVDVLGGLETAIQIAKEKAGIEEYRIVSLPKEKDPFESLLEDFTAEIKARVLKNELGDTYRYYEQTQDLINHGGIQARIPYEIELY